MEAVPSPATTLGIKANLPQFALLVGVNALVGALVGQERSLVPLLGDRVFGLGSSTALMLFLVSFGLAKAGANLAAGYLADKVGRRHILLAGWAVGVPVPIALMLAPSWGWVVVANVLLGINQGLAWSSTVVMKIDLAGPERRGLAMGLNEFAGYFAVAVSAAASGWLASRFGLRPEPLFLGLGVAVIGLGVSGLFVRDTSDHMELENANGASKSFIEVATLTSLGNRGLAAACRTGLVNNANDALAWGLLPIVMVGRGFDTVQIGIVAGIYPAVWAVAQLASGAWSDAVQRRLPVALGMFIQALGLVAFWLTSGFGAALGAAVLLGLGTACTYPSLLAAVGDLSAPAWRATAVGVYRTWRDSGYVLGALVAGLLTDAFGSGTALVAIAAATALSGVDSWRNLGSSSDDLKSLGSSDGRSSR